MPKVARDIVGQRFGKLVVVEKTTIKKGGNYLWLCKCDCGNEITTKKGRLESGETKSCGCVRKQSEIKTLNLGRNSDVKELTKIGNLDCAMNKNNTSGVKGVSWNKSTGKWLAHMTFQRKKVLQKNFANKQDAINARKEAEEKYFKPILEKYGKTQ